jgi:hypothetical protein
MGREGVGGQRWNPLVTLRATETLGYFDHTKSMRCSISERYTSYFISSTEKDRLSMESVLTEGVKSLQGDFGPYERLQ